VALLRNRRFVLLLAGVILCGAEIHWMTKAQLAQARHIEAVAANIQNEADARRRALEAEIRLKQARAETLLRSADEQGRSIFPASRATVPALVDRVQGVEREIRPLQAELVALGANNHPTPVISTEFDATLRATLIAGLGLVMMSTAGHMFRVARGVASNKGEQQEQQQPPREQQAEQQPASNEQQGRQQDLPLPRYSATTQFTPRRLADGRWLVPVAAAVAAAPAVAEQQAPEQQEQQQASNEQQGHVAEQQATSNEQQAPQQRATSNKPATKRATRPATKAPATTPATKLAQAIGAGEIQPNVRAVQAFEGVSTRAAMKLLAELEVGGVIKKAGRGYERA
jgi:hypothetical protein